MNGGKYLFQHKGDVPVPFVLIFVPSFIGPYLEKTIY